MFDPTDPTWNYLLRDERAVFSEIQAWVNRPPNLFDKAMALAGKPLEKV
jgi:hypothetical protein